MAMRKRILPQMRRRANKLKSGVTARQFSGGLNVVDSELNLNSKYSIVLDNIYRGLDGSNAVRQGCKLFTDVETISNGVLINGKYFFGRVISINSVGEVFATDSSGVSTRIWDSTIAAAKRTGLTTWGTTDVVAFEEFGGALTCHNGKDKPLSITSSFIVDYLADPATGANINVPVGSIVCKFDRHLVVAVGSSLYVSDEDSAGTYVGDSGALLAAIFEMKTRVVSGPTDIVGLTPFRGWLLVRFRECTIPVQFSKVSDGATPPSFTLQITDSSDVGGTLNQYGTFSQRTSQDIGDQTLICDISGVSSTALGTIFTQNLSPDRPSRLVDPLIKKAIRLLSNDTLQKNSFTEYDRLSSMYMLFLPDTVIEAQRELKGFGYRYIDKLKIAAWNTFSGWNWSWSARSSEGLIFFGRANSNQIFVKGDEEKLPLYADFIGDQEVFSDGLPFTDGTGLSPVSDVDTSGVPIRWTWDLPWSDLKNRGISKTSRYLIIDSQGSSEFTVKMFIDDKYFDKTDMGETFSDGTLFYDDLGFKRSDLTPALSDALNISMVGGDYGGYGEEPYGDIYGGGRNTTFKRSLPFPMKFTIFKLRFEGESMRPLKIVGITPQYMEGTIRRNSDV